MGVLSQNLFSMIVTMAILTTIAMPPMLRAALSRLPLGKDEKARLEREEFEQKGFVANLERLLLAVDESANAKFASHISGDVDITSSVRANTAPEEAILQEIGPSGADLVVIGVDRIHGETLNFGGVSDAVLRKSKVSVLLVSNGEASR